MAEPWGDRVWLSGDGYYDYISGEYSADAEPYLCEVALEQMLPDEIEIYRAIKRSGARSHADIARAIAQLYRLIPPENRTSTEQETLESP